MIPNNEKTKRIEILEIMADLLIAIYKERSKIPTNVERYAKSNPIKCIGLITTRNEMPTNSKIIGEIMEKIENPDDLNFERPANLEEQGAFDLRLYKSPYIK
jgi:hypothetical protein